MRGDTLVNRWIEEYGYNFVYDAVEKAIDVKEIKDSKEKIHRRDGEERIKQKAKEMGVRLL